MARGTAKAWQAGFTDPNTASVITQLFEWFATGEYSLKGLAAKARHEGFRLDDQKVHKSLVHQILRKRLYTGDFDWDGVTYHGTHAPLVTKETWNRVQSLLDAKQHRKKMTHDFTYSGIITCGHCGCSMVAEIKKGRYVYYHCTNGKSTDCPEPYTREELLTQTLTSVLGELIVPNAITAWLRAALQQTDLTQTRAREQALQQSQAAYERINARIDAMYLDKLDGRITASFYDEKVAAWRQEQAVLSRRINELRTTTKNYNTAIQAIETTSTLCREFPTKPPAAQRRLLKLIIDNATWKHGRLETTLRNPFQKLRVSNHASTTKHRENGPSGQEMQDWLLRKLRLESGLRRAVSKSDLTTEWLGVFLAPQ